MGKKENKRLDGETRTKGENGGRRSKEVEERIKGGGRGRRKVERGR